MNLAGIIFWSLVFVLIVVFALPAIIDAGVAIVEQVTP